MACHNRRDLTVRALKSLRESSELAGIQTDVILYDDGSTDGTAAAVHQIDGLNVHVITGDGSAYWASSMAAAERYALTRAGGDTQIILWLNDDVEIDPDAFVRTLDLAASEPNSVIVGAMRDPETGSPTYSGYKRKRIHPLRLKIVPPGDQVIALDTIHGNLVWVPATIARAVGGIDGEYAHAMADIDYGFRVRSLGFKILLMAGTAGRCSGNLSTYDGTTLDQWRWFVSRKGGGDFLTMKRILKKETRWWGVFAAYSYVAWWLRALVRAARSKRKSLRHA